MEPGDKQKLEPLATEKSGNVDEESDVEIRSKSVESEGDTYQLARDREKRIIRPPRKYIVLDLIAYALSAAHEINDDEPRTYLEVMTSKNRLNWERAMDEEIESLMKNETQELVRKPEKKRTVSCK